MKGKLLVIIIHSSQFESLRERNSRSGSFSVCIKIKSAFTLLNKREKKEKEKILLIKRLNLSMRVV